MMKDALLGKRAVVCGSTQGIGRAVALSLAEQGAGVTLLARDERKLADLYTRLATEHAQPHGYLVADFTEPEEVETAILSYRGTAHILVNNTGGPPAGAVTDAEPVAFERAFRQHLVCNQILAQALLPGMRQAGYGRIINIISTSAKEPIPYLGVSNTVRAAVANWSKSLAREVAADGVTVNNVLPGFTQTARLEQLIERTAARTGQTTEQVEADLVASVPARRFARASEVAQAVTFLASSAASYITGVNLPVDGGRTSSL